VDSMRRNDIVACDWYHPLVVSPAVYAASQCAGVDSPGVLTESP
jgi:hypothetical protein